MTQYHRPTIARALAGQSGYMKGFSKRMNRTRTDDEAPWQQHQPLDDHRAFVRQTGPSRMGPVSDEVVGVLMIEIDRVAHAADQYQRSPAQDSIGPYAAHGTDEQHRDADAQQNVTDHQPRRHHDTIHHFRSHEPSPNQDGPTGTASDGQPAPTTAQMWSLLPV